MELGGVCIKCANSFTSAEWYHYTNYGAAEQVIVLYMIAVAPRSRSNFQ